MKNVFYIFVAFVAITFASCDEEEIIDISIENGIYVGLFNRGAVAYEVNYNDIKPLGYSFQQKGAVIIDNKSFAATFPEDYSPQSTICTKTPIKKDDYEDAVLNSDKEFAGLHYAHNWNDVTFYGGDIFFAIKSLTNGNMQVTIIRLGNSLYYQTEAKVTTSNTPDAHRELTFKVVPEITNGDIEEWTMTLNPITSYQWSNLFSVYANGQSRFQVEVIDNGM